MEGCFYEHVRGLCCTALGAVGAGVTDRKWLASFGATAASIAVGVRAASSPQQQTPVSGTHRSRSPEQTWRQPRNLTDVLAPAVSCQQPRQDGNGPISARPAMVDP
ncbi:hypothetical protein GCM10018965_073590 [Nonomuraea roseola]